MSIAVVEPPENEPVDAVDLLKHVRELDASQTDYLASLGVAARESVESYCRRSFITQTLLLSLDAFPCDRTFIWLPRPPLQEVESIQYIDLSGNTVTWDPSNYKVDTRSLPGRIHLAYGKIWPLTRCEANAVLITYVAGYGDDGEQVPEGIKHGIKLFVGQLYEHREPVVTGTIATEIPMTIKAVLDQHRVLEF